MKSFVTATALLAAVCVVAGFSAPADSAAVKSLIDNEVQWTADFLSHDPAKVAAHYADDATFMTNGQPPVEGKAAIQAFMTRMVPNPAFSLTLHTQKAEVAKSGELGFTQGTYDLSFTDPASKQIVHDHGSYVTAYRRIDGSWKAISDISASQGMGAPPSN